jgi:hypothetical protein
MKISKIIAELPDIVKHLIIILIMLLSLNCQLLGQKVRETPPPLRERLFFGGSFGLQFGSYTNIEINPIIGLWVLPKVALAVGPGYQYFSDNYYNISTSVFSFKTYGEFVLFRDLNDFIPVGIHMGIVFHLEDELLNLESEYWQNVTTGPDRFWLNSLLLGGGLSQPLGKKGAFTILVLWVLNDSGYQIYDNPEIRIGFTF